MIISAYAPLFSLISPNLPIGGFSYSQGLEGFVENHLVIDKESFQSYLAHNMDAISNCDLPLLIRLYQNVENQDEFLKWSQISVAYRTTQEFRNEEIQKGKALSRLIKSISSFDNKTIDIASNSYLASFALFSYIKNIPQDEMLCAYLFSYIENQAIAAIKVVPLGQTDAWQIIDKLSNDVTSYIDNAKTVDDLSIGTGLTNLNIQSIKHEDQYSRIFRS